MKLRLKPVVRSLAVAFGGLAAVAAFPAAAQQQQQLERVEVTGSMIKRSQTETALPVTTISADELKKAGVTTAEQAMTFIAENQSSVGSSQSVGASNGGASFVDLRGLGATRTLVLLNGQRVVNNPYTAEAVDLNTLPSVAIQRIEVLRDGASAVYGTDAIAGVVNIITRKEYEGISVSAQGNWPQASGGESYGGSILGGFGSLEKQGWNVFGGFTYTQQNALAAIDRGFAATGINLDKGLVKTSGTSFPGNYSQSSTGVSSNPSVPNCSLPRSVLVPDVYGTSTCRYDYTQNIDLIGEQSQWSFYGRGTLALGTHNQVFLEYFSASNDLKTNVAPTPLPGLSMPSTSPYYPGKGATPITDPALDTSAPISVGWRMEPAGKRGDQMKNTTDRMMLGLTGDGAGWSYNVTGYYSSADVKHNFTDGYVNRSQIQNGVAGLGGAPWLNPFGAPTPAATDYIAANKILGTVQTIDGSIWGINGNAQKEIFKWSQGEVIMALGAEYRKEEANYTNNFALIRQAASSGLELTEDSSGSRNVTALMAEFNIPFLKTMELGLAVRWDDYSDVGSNVSPKVSFRWQALDNTLFRASYNQGFRAPTLYDIYDPNSITNTADNWDDPVLCPNGVAVPGADPSRNCGMQFNSMSGGNKNLKPETSESWSLGLVFDVTRNISVSVDYWNTKINDTVGVTPESSIFGDPAKYASLYVRCSQLPPAQRAVIDSCLGQGAVDPLAYVVQTTQNLGTIKAEGLDFGFQARSAATDYGTFGLSMQGTYLLKWDQQLEPGGPFYSALGKYSPDLGFPAIRWKHVIMANWNYGSWGANLFNRLSTSYTDQNQTEYGPPYDDNKVGAYSVWDLTGSWQGVKGLTVSAGVLNLFDEKPPFSNQGATFQVGYDPRYASPLGRQFFVRLGYEFK
jgi:iron complex outermembrane receptor protein